MKTPTLEEVKAYFKNAKEVKGNFKKFDISKILDTLHKASGCYWVILEDNYRPVVWGYDNGYAEIISYKSNPNIDLSKLTPDHIVELCKEPNIKEFMINNGVVKSELEVGRWNFITCYSFEYRFFIEEIKNNKVYGYGFDEKDEFYQSNELIGLNYIKTNRLLTPQEVETALKNEAVKRGFIDGVKYESPKCKIPNTCKGRFRFDAEINVLYNNGIAVFMDGVWAEIIKEETYIKIPLSVITLTESDKKLGKIVKNLAKNV
jgi:hypothetical protein